MNSPQNTFFPTLSTMKPRNGEAQAEIMNTTLEKRKNIFRRELAQHQCYRKKKFAATYKR